MYCVTVLFQIAQGQMDPFVPLMIENARTSLAKEPGCRVFDVWSEGSTVFLYEVYDNRAAFDAHLASEHFRAFDAAAGPMVVSKQITTLGTSHP